MWGLKVEMELKNRAIYKQREQRCFAVIFPIFKSLYEKKNDPRALAVRNTLIIFFIQFDLREYTKKQNIFL